MENISSYVISIYFHDLPGRFMVSCYNNQTKILRVGTVVAEFGRMLGPGEALLYIKEFARQERNKEIEFWRL
jgi:hypothetical protein